MDAPAEATPSRLDAAVRRAGRLSFLTVVLAVTAFFSVLWSAWGANKPHELRGVWLVSGLGIATAVVGLWTFASFVRAVRLRRTGELRARSLGLLALSFLVGGTTVGVLLYLTGNFLWSLWRSWS